MSTTTAKPKQARPPFSTVDRTILALHALLATVFTAVAFFQATDPGFGTLQRIVILMLFGLWAGGIVLMGMIARYVISNQWGRIALLVAGPFTGIALLIGRQYLV